MMKILIRIMMKIRIRIVIRILRRIMDTMDIIGIMDIMEIRDIIYIIDIMDNMDLVDIMIKTAWMAMACAVWALVLYNELLYKKIVLIQSSCLYGKWFLFKTMTFFLSSKGRLQLKILVVFTFKV